MDLITTTIKKSKYKLTRNQNTVGHSHFVNNKIKHNPHSKSKIGNRIHNRHHNSPFFGIHDLDFSNGLGGRGISGGLGGKKEKGEKERKINITSYKYT